MTIKKLKFEARTDKSYLAIRHMIRRKLKPLAEVANYLSRCEQMITLQDREASVLAISDPRRIIHLYKNFFPIHSHV